MQSRLFDFIAQISELKAAEVRKIKAAISPKSVKAGNLLFAAGEAVDHLYFIEGGLAVVRRPVPGGKRNVIEFVEPGHFAADYAAWVLRVPSMLDCEAVLPLEVSAVSFETYQLMTESVPALQLAARRILESLVVKLSIREHHLMTLTAGERLQHFTADRSHLLAHLSRNDLASYLNMEPQSLSRVRAAILKRKRAAT